MIAPSIMPPDALRAAILLTLVAAAAAQSPPPRLTPVMGWNAWNTFSTNGKPMRGGRKEYQEAAEAMISSGMVEAGYTLMSTVCTGWLGRDPVTKELQQNLTNWPGGMKDFADFLHAHGMQLSVYTDAAATNCCQEPGSAGYEDVDMKTFASWGVDAVGIDYCAGPQDVRAAYAKFASAIVKSGRTMQLGMWNLGQGQAWKWGPAMSANMTAMSQQQQGVFNGSWVPHLRLTRDIGNVWDGTGGPTESVMATVDEIQSIQDLWSFGMGNGSGTFPNYGQMVVGVPEGHPSAIDPGLTMTEAQSHFSIWCILGSLLLATNNVSQRDPAIETILLNNEAIAVNQDPWAVPAFRINASKHRGSRTTAGAATTRTGTNLTTAPAAPTEQWGRLLAGGDMAALILNRHSDNGDPSISARLDFADLLVAAGRRTATAGTDTTSPSYLVRDIQAKKDLGVACSGISFRLRPHETAFVRLTPAGPC